jgi:hypothetical protein
MKIENIIADREGWYELIFYCHPENGLLSASLKFPRDGRMVLTHDEDEAALLLDVLLAQPAEGSQYNNDSFVLQRNYDRIESKLYYVSFPSYPYDLFARDCDQYIGSLPPHKFAELSSRLRKAYSTSEPFGKMAGELGWPLAEDVPGIHEWEGYHDLPRTPVQWAKDKWVELNRNLMIWLIAKKAA